MGRQGLHQFIFGEGGTLTPLSSNASPPTQPNPAASPTHLIHLPHSRMAPAAPAPTTRSSRSHRRPIAELLAMAPASTSSSWRPLHLFLLLVAFRVVNALVVRTYFNPDEYLQGPEVAHKLVFGAGLL